MKIIKKKDSIVGLSVENFHLLLLWKSIPTNYTTFQLDILKVGGTPPKSG